jgi:predicted phosphoribosyltransferase
LFYSLPYQGHEEFAIGALTEDGVAEMDEEACRQLGLGDWRDDARVQAIIRREQEESRRRIAVYRGGCPLPDLSDTVAILVDDGVGRYRVLV